MEVMKDILIVAGTVAVIIATIFFVVVGWLVILVLVRVRAFFRTLERGSVKFGRFIDAVTNRMTGNFVSRIFRFLLRLGRH